MPPLPHTALDQLTYVSVGYAVLVSLAALSVAVARIERPQVLDNGVWILEALLVIRAVAGLGTILGGDRPSEPAAYVGYLVASFCVLPIAMQSVAEDRGSWGNAVITVACVAVSVIAVRLQMTS